jgi:hypothetical protein
MNTIVLPKSVMRGKEGVVILQLRKWQKIEEELENLEMYRSEALAKEIQKRRKEKGTVPLKNNVCPIRFVKQRE